LLVSFHTARNVESRGKSKMEFWEGAILVVGGVWLVSHMANKTNQQRFSGGPTVIGANSTNWLGALGVSNASNLTNITNTAGGQPTVLGEPLQPMQPGVSVPGTPARVIPFPVGQPIYRPVTPIARSGIILGGTSPPVRIPTTMSNPARLQLL
jgi:hypothetical protein